jgi:hypothetical protein
MTKKMTSNHCEGSMTGRVSERWRELQACRERSTQLESGGERKVKEGLSPRCLKDVIITGIRRVGRLTP